MHLVLHMYKPLKSLASGIGDAIVTRQRGIIREGAERLIALTYDAAEATHKVRTLGRERLARQSNKFGASRAHGKSLVE